MSNSTKNNVKLLTITVLYFGATGLSRSHATVPRDCRSRILELRDHRGTVPFIALINCDAEDPDFGMSGDMPIRLYYGDALIQICDSGVDLTVYAFHDTSLNAPEHMGLNDVLGWLYNMFRVDPVHDKFVINAVWPVRGQHGWQWRVVEVASTGSWRKFVSKVREKGYSLAIVVQKTTCVDRSGESSHAVVEETTLEGGQAENVWRTEQGRGEEVVEGNTQGEVIVRGTNREANDSDDEEPDSPMRVDATEENEAVVDQMEVENEEYLALVVEGEDTTLWDNETNIPDDWTTISMSRMKVNDGLDAHWCYDSKQVKVGQMFHDKGHLQDAVKRWAFVQKREFRVKVSNRTTNLTAAFVAQMVYSKVVRKTSLSPFTIMHDVEKEYGYEISYDKAWRAKQKALEMRFGTYEDSYHNLHPLLEVMQARNPGTHMAILDEVNEYGENVLRRAFWSFGCMIEAFRNCIPLLCVNGTFMTGKYRGTILTAIGVDADSHVVPVAFAFVESENTSSWLWFLRHIKMCVVENRPNMLVKKPIVARQEEPEGLEPIPNEAPSITRRRKRGRATKCFTEWVEFEPMEKWSLLYDTDGSRYGVMTTNLAEVYNWVMKNTRPLPLVAILEGITRGTQKYLCKRYSMASLNLSKPSVKYSPVITQYMDEKSKKGGIHRVWPAGNRELLFEIRLRDKSGVGIGTTDITLECTLWPEYHACKCNCNKTYLLHRPCSHVLAASAKGGVDGNIFVSPYFRKESWEATWRGELRGWRALCDFIRPPPGQANWVPDSNLLVDTKGRRQSRRIKNLMDEAEVKDRSRRMADQYDGQLIDKEIDRNHRSRRLSTGTFCNVLKMRGPDQYWRIDPRWVSRLRAAGLLTFARLVEPSRARSERIHIDAALLSALVDRWRPETHTFHLTVGEMVPTLQDVSYLLGLLIAGPAVGPTMVNAGWADDLLASFGGVLPVALEDLTDGHGPTKSWLNQFRQDVFPDDQEEWIVQRHLVAYLLWLFGWVMFTGTHADSVDKHFIHFAEQIAELPIAEIPQYSWGSAVLAATYAGLCDACVKNSKQSSLPGCPLLLMLWAHERFDIGRPQLDSYANYGLREMYRSGVDDIDDRPTMGSLWTHREPQWVSGTTRRVYTQFVADFDQLTPDRVRWTPYTQHDVNDRAPHGLADLCTRDMQLWMTTCHLVVDVHVEPHNVYRVLKQLGMYLDFPPRDGRPLADSLHRYSRKGLGLSYELVIVTTVQPTVQEWEHAADNLALQTPPDDGSYYGAYLHWYRSVTRWRCFPPQGDSTVPHQAAITDTFAPQPRSAYNSMAEFVEHVHVESDTLLQRLEARPPVVRLDDVASILRNFRARAAALLRRVSCRSAADVVQTSGRRPSPPLPRRSSMDRSGPSSSRRGTPQHRSTPGVSRIRGTHVEHGTTTSADDEYGSASTHHGMPAYSPRTTFIEDFFSTDPPQGEVGMDYWHAAPQVTQPTQETEAGQGPDVTPQQAARDRHPPDNLTYPTEQIRRRKKGGPSKRAKGTDRP
uniref:OSIGBa0139J17.4 protein n=1 Tax=Oryza sativa TaxID=4530 RepID=Q01LS0_ORYSA|nr:OSIGBa0139J17.4 [Oryza sativa]